MVTRAALIEELDRACYREASPHLLADGLDRVLSLVADAIEAQKGAGNEFRDVVIQRCADLVRSLGVDDD